MAVEKGETTSTVGVSQSQRRGDSDAELDGSDDSAATPTEDQEVVVQEEAKIPSATVEEGTDSKLRRQQRAAKITSKEEDSTEISVPVAKEEKDPETPSLGTQKTVTGKKARESTKVDVSDTVVDETSELDRVMSEPTETSVSNETESESNSVKDKKEETKK